MFEWDGGGGGSTDHHQLFNRVTWLVDEQSLKLFFLFFEQTRSQVLQVLFVLVVFPYFIFISHEQIYA